MKVKKKLPEDLLDDELGVPDGCRRGQVHRPDSWGKRTEEEEEGETDGIKRKRGHSCLFFCWRGELATEPGRKRGTGRGFYEGWRVDWKRSRAGPAFLPNLTWIFGTHFIASCATNYASRASHRRGYGVCIFPPSFFGYWFLHLLVNEEIEGELFTCNSWYLPTTSPTESTRHSYRRHFSDIPSLVSKVLRRRSETQRKRVTCIDVS